MGPLRTCLSASSSSSGCWTLQVMEHMDMGSLHSVNKGIFHQRQTPRPEAADMKAILLSAAEIASAMCYLHGKDILHGNLSGGPQH